MNRRRTPLLLVALSALFSPPHSAALAQPPGGSPPEAAPRPAVAAGPLETGLGELTAQVQRLGQAAEAAAKLAEDLVTVGQRLVGVQRGLAAHAAALNEEVAVVTEHVEALKAAGAENEATIVWLRTELKDTRAEARALAERLEASRQGIEELRATLVAPVAPGDAAEGEGEANRGSATGGAGSSATPPAAPMAATPSARSAGDATGYYVATTRVNLRGAPRLAAEVLMVVDEGDVVRGIGSQGDWLQVEYTDDRAGDVTGWVHSGSLRRVEAPSPGHGPSAPAGDR